MRHPMWIPAAVGLFFALACGAFEPTVTTSLTVSNQPFIPNRCYSGEIRGFSGIELEDVAGARLRLVHQPDGTLGVTWMPAGESVGTTLGTCASGAFSPGSMTVNDVKGLTGAATIDCATAAIPIVGSVAVENCSTYMF